MATLTTASKPTRPVKTNSGLIRGLCERDAISFKGIRYGADTSGGNRFLPPQSVTTWSGERDAFAYGPTAPQIGAEPSRSAFSHLLRSDEEQSEDCLVLNVWTPALDSNRRPVMVWLHGGAFVAGTASAPITDGCDLAKAEDVVVVSMNHRLDVLGFLDLSSFTDDLRYADSVNCGILDVVAALEWVRDNIANFGGDPDRVTIFGESGGALKVATLMAMPAARGLFQRAAIESAAGIRCRTRDASSATGAAFLQELGTPADLRTLQSLPLASLIAASRALRGRKDFAPGVDGGWGPTVDGRVLPGHPFDPEASPISADIPLIVGTTRTEATYITASDHAGFELDDAGLDLRVRAMFDDADTTRVLELYRAKYPEASCSDLYFMIGTDQWLTVASARLAELKAAQMAAPVWLYRFDWRTPVDDGKWRSPHTIELPFVFRTALRPELTVMVGPDVDNGLVDQVSGAWGAFARDGNPNGGALPAWPPYDPSTRHVMVFDTPCRAVSRLDDDLRELLQRIAFPTSGGRGEQLFAARDVSKRTQSPNKQ